MKTRTRTTRPWRTCTAGGKQPPSATQSVATTQMAAVTIYDKPAAQKGVIQTPDLACLRHALVDSCPTGCHTNTRLSLHHIINTVPLSRQQAALLTGASRQGLQSPLKAGLCVLPPPLTTLAWNSEMEENSRKQQSWNVHIGPHSLTLHLEIQLLTRSVARLLSDPPTSHC
jgi:hypothetical protein